MPSHDLPDDVIEWLLGGRPGGADEHVDLRAFVADVRAAADGPAPEPIRELATVLASGFSTEKGDLLVTAGSNVTGPAPQAAGLPKWRQENVIGSTGFLSGLVSKLAGSGVVAKALMAVGLSVAGLTATGAAGALPGPAQHALAGVVKTVTPFHIPDGAGTGPHGQATGSVQTGGDTHSDADANVALGGGVTPSGGTTPSSSSGAQASAGVTNGHAQGSANVAANTALPTVPASLPSLPGLGHLPAQVSKCVSTIVDPTTGHLLVAPTELASKVLACVQQLVPAGAVPPAVSTCISSLLNSIGGLAGGGVPTGVPHIDVSSCVPVDVSQCASSIMHAFGSSASLMPSFSNLANLANPANWANLAHLGNLANLAQLPGCVPFDVGKCVSTILNSVGGAAATPGTMPHIDLSACVPTNLFSALPFGNH